VELEDFDEPPHAGNAPIASAQVITTNLFEHLCTEFPVQDVLTDVEISTQENQSLIAAVAREGNKKIV
jgi:hypothetical protein